MNLHFRRATANDAPAVGRLYRFLVNDRNIQVRPENVQSIETDSSNFLMLACFGDEIVATAFLVICRDVMYGDQPFALLENIVVNPALRGQGIGRKFMDELVRQCRGHRCTKIMLLSSATRGEAHRFFESCGYRGDLKRGFVNYLNRNS